MVSGRSRIVVAAICLVLFIDSAAAQSLRASLTGQVRDSTGAVVVGATVTIRPPGSAAGPTVLTDARGAYQFADLTAGEYLISVTRTGFEPVHERITLRTDRPGTRDVLLTVAPVSEAVTVRFTAPRNQTALKYDSDIRDQPRSVTTYTADFMRGINARRTEDLFPYITGVTRAGDTAYDFTIRGVRSREPNNILIDGLPGLPARFGSPPVSGVDRIEVLRGPASALYGQIQPGGMLNIITKKPTAERTAQFDVRFGALDSAKPGVQSVAQFDAELSGRVDRHAKFLYRLTFAYDHNESFRATVSERNILVAPRLTWAPSVRTSLELGLEYRRERVSFDDGLVAPGNDITRVAEFATVYQEPGDYVQENGSVATLRFTRLLTPQVTLTSKWRAVVHDDERHGYENFQVGRDLVSVQRRDREQITERRYNYVESNVQARVAALGVEHTLLAGITGGYELRAPNQVTLTSSPSLTVNLYAPVYGAPRPQPVAGPYRRDQFVSGAAFVQDHVSLSRWLKGVAAVRFDEQRARSRDMRSSTTRTTRPSAWSHMAGLVFTPGARWSVYTNASTSFAPPNPQAQDANGQNNFEPESGREVEVGARAAFGAIESTVAWFIIDRQNVLNMVGGGITTQTTEERSRGAEAELRARLGGLQAIVGYAYTDARVTRDAVPINVGARVNNVPKHAASLWAHYEVPASALRGLGVGVGLVYRGDRAGSAPSAVGAVLRLPSYTRSDSSVSYRRGRYDVRLQTTNLTNRQYFESALSALSIQPAQPRRSVLSLRVHF
jgi:iron complex outermembrane recepter protein